MAVPASTVELLDLVRKSGICPADALDQQLQQSPELSEDPMQTAALLVKRGVLTAFQAKLLLSGRYRGFRLGSYVIRDQIGQGGMGAVYLAEHETLRRRVAIKVLSPNDGMNKVAVERFLREARAAAALDHPNIVRIFDVAQQGDMYFLVMEYVEGQTLDQIVDRSGPMACGRAVEHILQAAAGLQHAFEKGFVHRDIKPGNLILAKDGTVKILDMGLARSFELNDKLTEILDKGAVVGTADYISPEQAMNSPDLDIRADIYSLGATFFTLVTGKPPFEGNTTQKLLQHQMKEPPSLDTIDRTFPPGLADVVVKMLRKKPSDRFQTPSEVIAALGPWLPNNARVVATLSRSNLGKSSDLQNTLNEVVSGRTKRMSDAATATLNAKKSRSKLRYVLIGLFALLMVAGGIAAAFFTSGGSSDVAVTPIPKGPDKAATTVPTVATPTAGKTTPTTPTTAKTGDPKVAKTPTPKARIEPVIPLGTILYELDLTGVNPYSERARMVASDPAKPDAKKWTTQSKTGDGKLPAGWRSQSWSADSEVEFSIAETKGSLSINMTTLTGPASAMLLSPDLQFNQPKCKVRVEYLTVVSGAGIMVKFRPTKPSQQPAFEVSKLPVTNGEWKTQEIELDLKGATGGFVEFHNYTQANHPISIRALTVSEAPPMQTVLMKLDLSTQEPFTMKVVTQDVGMTRKMNIIEETGTGKLPSMWYRWVDKNDTICEYFAEGAEGRMALGTRILSGGGGMLLNSQEFKPTTGKALARIVYRTGSESAAVSVRLRQTFGGNRTYEVLALPPTTNGYRQVLVPIDMQGATAGLLEFYSTTSGEEGSLRLREVLVTEVQ